MIEHKKNHENSEIVKIAKISRGNLKNFYRPQEHAFNNKTGKYHWGTDANLSEIRYPDSAHQNNALICTYCNKAVTEISPDKNIMSLIAQSLRVEIFREHCRKCALKKK